MTFSLPLKFLYLFYNSVDELLHHSVITSLQIFPIYLIAWENFVFHPNE